MEDIETRCCRCNTSSNEMLTIAFILTDNYSKKQTEIILCQACQDFIKDYASNNDYSWKGGDDGSM